MLTAIILALLTALQAPPTGRASFEPGNGPLPYVIEPPDVLVLEPQCPEVGLLALVRGEHAVRPDGTIDLGPFGSVYVAGLTVAQAKLAIERHLGPHAVAPAVTVEVWTEGRQAYHVIWKGRDNRQRAYCLTLTGKETVLDAVAGTGEVCSGSLTVYVARPIPRRPGCLQVLWVDWGCMVWYGEARTNYPIEPGDCVYVIHDPTARQALPYPVQEGPMATLLLFQAPPRPIEQAWAEAQALVERVCPALHWALQLQGLLDPGPGRPPTEL